jgi:hypothetical protein
VDLYVGVIHLHEDANGVYALEEEQVFLSFYAVGGEGDDRKDDDGHLQDVVPCFYLVRF